MQLSKDLKPALAAISGGLGDIGKAIGRALSGAGAEIAIADLVPQDEAQSDGHFYGQVDVTDPEAVEQWFVQVTNRFGRAPNIIVPNAATATFKLHLEISPGEWKREIDVNLNGAYYFADSGTRRLAQTNRPGRVVFMGSWAAHAPHRRLPAYSAAKAGLRMLTQTLALELASRGILVNEVSPGYVNAGLSGRAFAADPALKLEAKNKVPTRILNTADDVALQVLYLCSPASVHITGTTIVQDGGLSLLQGPFSE